MDKLDATVTLMRQAQQPEAGEARGKRERTKARNRTVILTAAREVFATLGFEAATVRDVIRGTDLAVGTFYQYFRDKEEVFAAVAEQATTDVRARLRLVRRNRDQPFGARMVAAYRAFFEFVVEERMLFEVLDRNLASIPGDLYRASVAMATRELRDDLMPDLASIELTGEELNCAAAAIVGIATGVAKMLIEQDEPDVEAAAELCAKLTMGGLAEAVGLDREIPPGSTGR